MIVIDASAVVAIMAGESEGRDLSDRLDLVPPILAARFISTVSIWEAACAVARIWRCNRTVGVEAVQEFLTSKLTPAPNVASVKTSLTIRTAKQLPGVPLD